MAEHGTVNGYRKFRCGKYSPCPASPTCAEAKAATRTGAPAGRSQVAPRALRQPAGLTPDPGAPPAAPPVDRPLPTRTPGPQGEAIRAQYSALDDEARGKVAVLLAAADALAYVIDYGTPGQIPPAVKALREVEADIQDRMEGETSDEFSRLMASLADVSTPVRDGAELGS